MTRQRARGFTLLELVITVAIVGILASVAVPLGALSVQRAKEQELRAALRQIRTALDDYQRATLEGRIERRADGSGYPVQLEALVEGVADAKSPAQAKIYFLRRLPRDPFHTDPDTAAAATWGKRAYASPPDRPESGSDVYDVYSLSDQVGLNGIAVKDW
jgi:general secretion pathway protein G